jgi:hypothetical protein
MFSMNTGITLHQTYVCCQAVGHLADAMAAKREAPARRAAMLRNLAGAMLRCAAWLVASLGL